VSQRPATLTLLLAGSQDQWYRYAAAVETLATLGRRGVDCRLIVTGRMGWTSAQGEGRARAEKFARDQQVLDRIEFTGPYSQLQAPAIYRRADILIHTKYNDPCPSVVCEALASGLPVAYSDSGGVPELVGDAGIGVPSPRSWQQDHPPHPEQLADAVQAIAATRVEYSLRARRRSVEKLNLDHWLERHRAVFAGASTRLEQTAQ
jgi:glycosyltransferase involved in cell wall biosynthesis